MMVKDILEGSIGSSKACSNSRPLVIDLDMSEIFIFMFLKYLFIYLAALGLSCSMRYL